jgi:hypothetical protein
MTMPTSTESLAIMRTFRLRARHDIISDAFNYAIACIEEVQSRRTLTPSEITEPGLYLAKTADGEVIALRVMAHEIEKGTVFMGLLYQGPLVWEEEPCPFNK